jgi:RNA polymerase sigma-70 factor (ECF subfamily)
LYLHALVARVTHAPSSALPATAQPLGSCAAPGDRAPNTALGDAALGDAALVRRVLAGDAEAFCPLVERHYARCLRLAVHLLGDRADAEDAVQDTLLRAYRHLAGYREQDRFGAWLARILVNQCRTARARARAAERPLPPGVDWAAADRVTAHPADAGAPDAERREALARALARLPGEQREAVVLRYGDDLSFAEMAAATGATAAALKMRVRRACDRLRALLAPAPSLVPERAPDADAAV